MATTRPRKPLSIGVSKGRLLESQLQLLAQAGIELPPDDERKLRAISTSGKHQIITLRGKDLPQLLFQGAADVGLVGLDSVREKPDCTLFELLDTGLGRCRLVLAAKKGTDLTPAKEWCIATSYPNLAQKHLGALGVNYRLVALTGSVELAPSIGMADAVVDIVESGATLRANDLEVHSELQEISTWLVCNRASYHLQRAAVLELVESLRIARESS